MATYDVGDLVRITGTFTNAAGSAVAPSGTVTFYVLDPLGSTTTYSGTQITNSGTGVYYADITASYAGRYHWRVDAGGTVGQSAEETYFDITQSWFSGVRAGMREIIYQWRRLVSDAAGSVFADWEAQEILDTHRIEIYGRELQQVPLALNGTTVYQTYMVGAMPLEGTASGTAAWRVYDTNGTAASGYTLDYTRGIVQFTADQRGSARYVDARSYDLNGAAARGWRELAASKASLYKFTADGASYERQQWFDHCMAMAVHYDAMATTGAGGGLSVGMMWRGDVNTEPLPWGW